MDNLLPDYSGATFYTFMQVDRSILDKRKDFHFYLKFWRRESPFTEHLGATLQAKHFIHYLG